MANVIRKLTTDSLYFEVLPSAARSSAPDTQEFELLGRGYEYNGLHLVIDLTAFTTAASLTVTVAGVDRISGKLYTILASAAITATGTTVLKIAPGLTAAANLAVNDHLPPVFRVTVAHGNGNSHTYSIGGMLV